MTELVSPRAVLFDAGGTLVLQDPVEMGDQLGWDIDPQDAFDAHYRTMAEFSELRISGSEATWDWWLERYFTRLGHTAPDRAGRIIDRGYGLWHWAIPGAARGVQRLVDAGVRVAVVSNSDGSVALSLEKAGLGDMFEFVLDSELVGVKKPDPEIFLIAVERLGVEPGEVWYVGDSMFHDVGGAEAAGLGGAWLIDPLDLHPAVDRRVPSVDHLPRPTSNPGLNPGL